MSSVLLTLVHEKRQARRTYELRKMVSIFKERNSPCILERQEYLELADLSHQMAYKRSTLQGRATPSGANPVTSPPDVECDDGGDAFDVDSGNALRLLHGRSCPLAPAAP